MKRELLEFQSTRPARGATRKGICSELRTRDFNPRAPRGARHPPEEYDYTVDGISIHAPREGRDGIAFFADLLFDISIHAPREGRDDLVISWAVLVRYFNPRAPRGARRWLPAALKA